MKYIEHKGKKSEKKVLNEMSKRDRESALKVKNVIFSNQTNETIHLFIEHKLGMGNYLEASLEPGDGLDLTNKSRHPLSLIQLIWIRLAEDGSLIIDCETGE